MAKKAAVQEVVAVPGAPRKLRPGEWHQAGTPVYRKTPIATGDTTTLPDSGVVATVDVYAEVYAQGAVTKSYILAAKAGVPTYFN